MGTEERKREKEKSVSKIIMEYQGKLMLIKNSMWAIEKILS